MNIKPRYDLEAFDEITVNGRPGFVVIPQYRSHLGVYPDGSPRHIGFGCVAVKFFGHDRLSIIHPDDVVLSKGGEA